MARGGGQGRAGPPPLSVTCPGSISYAISKRPADDKRALMKLCGINPIAGGVQAYFPNSLNPIPGGSRSCTVAASDEVLWSDPPGPPTCGGTPWRCSHGTPHPAKTYEEYYNACHSVNPKLPDPGTFYNSTKAPCTTRDVKVSFGIATAPVMNRGDCQSAAKDAGFNSTYVPTIEEFCSNPNYWGTDFCTAYCIDGPGRRTAACETGYKAFCTGDKLLPRAALSGGNDRCWEYAKTIGSSWFSEEMAKRCIKPGALNDRACFGEQSYVCSKDSAGKPFEPGNRFGWCTTALQGLCVTDGHRHELCSCVKPFNNSEKQAVGTSLAAASRYCFGGAAGTDTQNSHMTCRTKGYRLDPAEKCQDICTAINTAINFGTVNMKGNNLMCGGDQAVQMISYPGDLSSISEWNQWWPTGGSLFSDTSIPSLSQFASSFARVIAKTTKSADIDAAENVIPSIQSEAARDIASTAVDRWRVSNTSAPGTAAVPAPVPAPDPSTDIQVGYNPLEEPIQPTPEREELVKQALENDTKNGEILRKLLVGGVVTIAACILCLVVCGILVLVRN